VFFAAGEVLTPDRRVIATASGVFKPGRLAEITCLKDVKKLALSAA
jgi:hypothetical protein